MFKDHFITVYDGSREVMIDQRDGTRYELVRQRGQMAYLRRMEGKAISTPTRYVKAEGHRPRTVEQVETKRTGVARFYASETAQTDWRTALTEVF